MLKPNTGRIIVELLKTGEKQGDLYLPNRENVKAGENLFIGRVIHPGDWGHDYAGAKRFKEGQLVMFQEYSMSGIYKDTKALVDGTVSFSDSMKPENQYHVIAVTDIMAYEE